MKSYLLTTSCLVMLLVSCGKKAENQDQSNTESVQPSEAEVNFYALKEVRRAVVENDLTSLKRVLLENPGTDLNQIQTDGETYLTLAIKYNFTDIRNFLIEKGSSINQPNVNKETPLMVAILKKRLNTVRVLLDLHADLEKKDANGDTALIIAIKNLDEVSALLLINHGANLQTNDRQEHSPLKIAQDNKMDNVADRINTILKVEFGAPDLASFRSVLLQGDNSRLKKIIDTYPSLVNDYESCNPLALVIDVKNENAAFKSAELLLDSKVNVNGPKDADVTPLIKATTAKKQHFVSLFLSKQANPQLLDKEGKSALIHAVELNDAFMVESLLNHSAVEKYTFRKDGKKITYDACSVARDMNKKLKTEFEKDTNLIIQDKLDCSFWRRLF